MQSAAVAQPKQPAHGNIHRKCAPEENYRIKRSSTFRGPVLTPKKYRYKSRCQRELTDDVSRQILIHIPQAIRSVHNNNPVVQYVCLELKQFPVCKPSDLRTVARMSLKVFSSAET